MLNTSDSVAGSPVSSILPDSSMVEVAVSGRESLGKLISIGSRKFIINQRPIILNGKSTGAVATMQPYERIIKTARLAQKHVSKGLVAKYSLDDFM